MSSVETKNMFIKYFFSSEDGSQHSRNLFDADVRVYIPALVLGADLRGHADQAVHVSYVMLKVLFVISAIQPTTLSHHHSRRTV